ncbi:MAG: SRPBCC family protein [Microthrixaceae bacterium]|nr:SRPBCC family protein [Microthrixaceae bacterium]MCO5313873.1 SRPBCC family protein [Microthrixaceae bacterium]
MTDDAKQVSASREIAAAPAELFKIVADASFHPVIDGSGTVRSSTGKSEPLKLGSKFGMNMKMFLPYRLTSTVVEFEQDRLIAWQHPGKHIWRYTFEPLDDVDGTPRTLVTETFDWRPSPIKFYIEGLGWPKRHKVNMAKTLENLDTYVTNRSSAL